MFKKEKETKNLQKLKQKMEVSEYIDTLKVHMHHRISSNQFR